MVHTVEERIDCLERSSRRWRIAAFVLVGAFVVAHVAGVARQHDEAGQFIRELRVESLAVLSDDGSTRIVISGGNATVGPSITMSGMRGELAGTWMVDGESNRRGLIITAEDPSASQGQRIAASIGTTENVGGYVMVRDLAGVPVASINEDGRGQVAVLRRSGAAAVSLEMDEHLGSVMYDRTNRYIVERQIATLSTRRRVLQTLGSDYAEEASDLVERISLLRSRLRELDAQP